VFPLTGLPVGSATAAASRPALSIKVENTPPARPQAGLDAADVVAEVQFATRAPAGGHTVRAMTVPFSPVADYVASWRWDPKAGLWDRYQGGRRATVAGGAGVTATNVVVLRVKVGTIPGMVDSLGNPAPNVIVVGQGACWVLRDGSIGSLTPARRTTRGLTANASTRRASWRFEPDGGAARSGGVGSGDGDVALHSPIAGQRARSRFSRPVRPTASSADTSSYQRDLERSRHDEGGASRPARSDLSRAAINARNEHGVPSRARLRNRLVGCGGRGWAGNQQARKVRAPRPAVCPCRRRQPRPIGRLAQDPGQHEHLARRHQLLNLAMAGVELAAVLVAGVGCGGHDGQQLVDPSDRLTGQPYVHLVLLR
jgi:hypothetical protein